MPPRSAALLAQWNRLTAAPLSDAELLERWLARREEDAFAALVARHGRMVQGVCRRVLGNSHDVEDAFQAVFLILARKAASLRHPEALPGWLHGVAVRVAGKARAAAARRPSNDPRVEPSDPSPDPLDALSAREMLVLIDREIACLPERYRLPVVLCDLEERAQAEAARMLGWTLGSLRGRLMRGRERLRSRLARRGIAPAVLFAAGLRSSVEAAGHVSLAEMSPSVAALVREGMRGFMLAKLKLASILVLVAGTLAAGAGLLAWPTPSAPPAAARTEKQQAATTPNDKPQVRRDRAGDPLPPEALSRLGTTRFRAGGSIQSLAFGPDGKSLATHGGGGIRFWDTATGKQIPRFAEQKQAVSMAVTADGKLLAVRIKSDDAKVKPIALREFATGRLLRRFGEEKTPWKLLFSPDGKTLAAHPWWTHDMELWDSSSGRRLHVLKGHKGTIWSVAFSTDGKTFVSGSEDKTIRFWEVATGKEVRKIQHRQGIGKIALSPDGKLLASIDRIKHIDKEYGSGYWSDDNRVLLWDAAAGKELRMLALPPNDLLDPRYGIRFLRFAPDGKTLLTGSGDGTLRFWNPATGKESRRFTDFGIIPGPFVFAPDGKSLAVVDGGTIRLLDLATGKDRVPSLGHRDRVTSIRVASDGRSIATIGRDNTLRFWESATGKELRHRRLPGGYFPIPRFQGSEGSFLTVGTDKQYRLNDLTSGKETAILRGHKAFYPFAVSLDGKNLASANAEKEVRLLDPATGAVRHLLTKVKHHVTGMSFSADGRTLVVWDADRSVTVWDTATGKKKREFRVPTELGSTPGFDRNFAVPYNATLSPDGKLLAFGLQDFDAKAKQNILPVLDTSTGKEVCRFPKSKGRTEIMAFSPDSKSLAWPEGFGEGITLGEIATGKMRHRLEGCRAGISSLAFSPDGKMLISGSEDTTAFVWDLTGRLAQGKQFAAALSNEDLDAQWKALAGKDAAAGYRAVQKLAADPIRAIPYLRKRLRPVAPADEKRLKQWIADLDSEQFAVREKAAAELEKCGAAALHAMRGTLDERPTLETRRRLEQLIAKQERAEWAPIPENIRNQRALEVLERADTKEAKEVLAILAGGTPGARLTRDAKAALARKP